MKLKPEKSTDPQSSPQPPRLQRPRKDPDYGKVRFNVEKYLEKRNPESYGCKTIPIPRSKA